VHVSTGCLVVTGWVERRFVNDLGVSIYVLWPFAKGREVVADRAFLLDSRVDFSFANDFGGWRLASFNRRPTARRLTGDQRRLAEKDQPKDEQF